MFFFKILRSPKLLFQKNVISFLVIRRYDFKDMEDLLGYVHVKPKGSVFHLRQKLWHLLDLPDFSDEIMLLRTHNGIEIPLIELRRGNKPEYPFILEIWSLKKRLSNSFSSKLTSSLYNREDKMLTYLNDSNITICEITTVGTSIDKSVNGHNENEEKFRYECRPGFKEGQDYRSKYNSSSRMSKQKVMNGKGFAQNHFLHEFNVKSDLSCKMSSSSIRFKLPGRKKSKDNIFNMLELIQNDLSLLCTKIAVLESKVQGLL